MSFEQATKEKNIKNFINDRLPKIAKFLHRQNVDVNDEDYGNIVIRSGWTYLLGDYTGTLIFERDFGIEYNEAPLVFVSTIGSRGIQYGLPNDPHDLWDEPPPLAIHVLPAWANKCEIKLMAVPGGTFNDQVYYGILWTAIGKKT